jgi:hypothetical protein
VPKPYSEIPSPDPPVVLHNGPRFTDQQEARYFHYYCTEIAVNIAPMNCRSSIWDQIIPQAGESETFIAHTIAALGALSLSHTMSKNSLSSSQAMSVTAKADPHYQYALKQYGKGLNLMRRGLQEKLWGRTRTALIASLVIFCVESLLGDPDSASIHASRSMSLLYQWVPQHAVRDKHLCAQDAFEEALYPAFPGLDLQAMLHLDHRPPSLHYRFQKYLSDGLEDSPKTFTNINDCIIGGQLLLRRTLHFIAASRILDGYPNITDLPEPIANSKSWSVALGPLSIPPSKRVEQRSYLTDITKYKAAMNELLQTTGDSEHSIAFYAGSICRVHTAMNTILLTAACFPQRTSLDSLLPDFQEIVTLCQVLYKQASSSGGSTFFFDMGLIVPLSVVAIRCRDRGLRNEAIELLLSSPGYREGIWDAEAMGRVCQWFLGIEKEAGLDELAYVAGGIEGEGRLMKDGTAGHDKIPTLLMVHFELNERRARAFCAVPGSGKAGEMALKEGNINW